MANKILTTNYLSRLSNANHDGVTQQISERLTAFGSNNAMVQSALQGVTAAREAEDLAFKRYSGKDFASDDLKKEDGLEDKYMSASLGILNGLLALPETEPIYRKAQMAKQVFKDFDFSTSNGFEAEARKVLNMSQQWQAATEYELAELGIEVWVQKAVAQANKVLQLVTVRVDHESAKVKGELAEARKATDAAIRQAYDIINALKVLQPSAELSALINVLLSIEERAKLYYISGSSAGNVRPNGGGSEGQPSSEGGQQGGGTVTPDPGTGGGETPDPGTGGGGTDTPVTPDPGTGGGGTTPGPDDPTNSED